MLSQVQLFVSNNLMSASATAAIVIEFALRLVPSSKPLSILYAISAAVHSLGIIFDGIATFLDKILPQNLK